MKGSRAIAAMSILFAVAAVPGMAAAWEVRLRSGVATQSAIVRLQDVADVVGDDVPSDAAVGQIVVALGPTRNRNRELSPSDVRKTLAAHGVDLRQCQFTGAARVFITFGDEPAAVSGEPERAVMPPSRSRARSQQPGTTALQQQLEDMVAQRLQQLSGDGCPWKADVTLAERVPADLLREGSGITVESLTAATEGPHQLVACLAEGPTSVRVPFEARTRKLIPVVVPVRALARGELIRAGDVELRHVDEVSEPGALVQRLEDAVGRQARQGVSADQPLNARSLQQPLLVRKRDEVDVFVRCGGIRAHRRAVALNDGTRGDMITVETSDGSKTQFNARVVDIRQVEVLPNSTSAGQ